MHVKGLPENVREFYEILNYEKDIYFSRIFDAELGPSYPCNDGTIVSDIFGACAWSVWSCMFSGDGTYFGEDAVKPREDGRSNIFIESKRLSLKIEIYSEEPGVGFAEHYIVDNGVMIENEECKYEEYWVDDINPLTKENIEEELGIAITTDEFKAAVKDGVIIRGGFNAEYTF